MLPTPDFGYRSQQLFAGILPALTTASIARAGTGPEEAGGLLTGPVLHMLDMGIDVLLVSLIASAWTPSAAAILCCLGAVLCLPNYGYGLAPGLFRGLFPGEYAGNSSITIWFVPFDIVGTLALALAAGTACSVLRQSHLDYSLPRKRSRWPFHLEPTVSLESRQVLGVIAPAFVLAYLVRLLNLNPQLVVGGVIVPLANLQMWGTDVLLISLMLVPWKLRWAANLCILGALLCLPVYAWNIAQGFRNWVSPPDYTRPPIYYFGANVISVAAAGAACRAKKNVQEKSRRR